jgi:hypothetical protein
MKKVGELKKQKEKHKKLQHNRDQLALAKNGAEIISLYILYHGVPKLVKVNTGIVTTSIFEEDSGYKEFVILKHSGRNKLVSGILYEKDGRGCLVTSQKSRDLYLGQFTVIGLIENED